MESLVGYESNEECGNSPEGAKKAVNERQQLLHSCNSGPSTQESVEDHLADEYATFQAMVSEVPASNSDNIIKQSDAGNESDGNKEQSPYQTKNDNEWAFTKYEETDPAELLPQLRRAAASLSDSDSDSDEDEETNDHGKKSKKHKLCKNHKKKKKKHASSDSDSAGDRTSSSESSSNESSSEEEKHKKRQRKRSRKQKDKSKSKKKKREVSSSEKSDNEKGNKLSAGEEKIEDDPEVKSKQESIGSRLAQIASIDIISKKSRSQSPGKSRSHKEHHGSKSHERRKHSRRSRSRTPSHKERRRKYSRSRSPKSKSSSGSKANRLKSRRSRSRERHGRHRSRSRSQKRNHRSRSREKRRKRSRSRDDHSRKGHKKPSSDRSHEHRRRKSRSRSKSKSRDQKIVVSTVGEKKKNQPLSFKEQLKAKFLEVQRQANDGTLDLSTLQSTETGPSHEQPSSLPLKNINPLMALATDAVSVVGSQISLAQVTPQQALLHTMAAMHQKLLLQAQEVTGVAVPKYYNPAAVNPLKYAEQVTKRKMLWSKAKDHREDNKDQWGHSSFSQDQDGKVAAKFRKLMGLKEGEVDSDEDEECAEKPTMQKQKEMFARLDKEYEFARMTTHTHRGIGLGFQSLGLPDVPEEQQAQQTDTPLEQQKQ